MHANRTVGRNYCTKTIIHISQNKRGVAATLAYTYVGLTYVNNVVATIVHRYYFVINIVMRTTKPTSACRGVARSAREHQSWTRARLAGASKFSSKAIISFSTNKEKEEEEIFLSSSFIVTEEEEEEEEKLWRRRHSS